LRNPKNPRSDHRELLSHENLNRVFTLRERRRLTLNITLHYKRVMNVIRETPLAQKLRERSAEGDRRSVHR
jgi:hypothetical protein